MGVSSFRETLLSEPRNRTVRFYIKTALQAVHISLIIMTNSSSSDETILLKATYTTLH